MRQVVFRMTNALANLFTSLSLFCGFISLIFSLERHFTFACWAIILAVIFDGLDGQVARKDRPLSDFGKQFDSLADVVAFGVSPSVLGYIFVYQGFYLLAALALFIYLGSSVVRLARYNISPKEKSAPYFYGLPTTVSGGLLASFILIYRQYTKSPPPMLFLLLVLILAFLMASRIRYLNLDGLRLVLNKPVLTVFIIALLGAVFFPGIVLFLFFALYVIFAPLVVKKLDFK